jgi:hypothetical protein
MQMVHWRELIVCIAAEGLEQVTLFRFARFSVGLLVFTLRHDVPTAPLVVGRLPINNDYN